MNTNEVETAYDVERVDEDSLPQGNPIIVIFVLMICLSLLAFIVSSIAQAADTLQQGKSNGTSKYHIANWKPPVAPKVTLPDLVSDDLAKEIADNWGIELISLRLTAAGYMIDFRFRVLNVEKAKVFFDNRVKPHLVVERSNAKLPIPMAAKVGAFRTTNRGQNIKPDKIYYMVFGNPDSHVKSGEKVTMVIGGFMAKHLKVQ
jgi:hypothetical protein